MTAKFERAKPIWVTNRESEVNLRVQFKAVIEKNEVAIIKIATSGMYQLWVNGSFVSYGPARAGKNHFRMDEIDITHKLSDRHNVIIIEVAGYNANSFAVQNQKSFLQAEIADENGVIAFTGKDFTARVNPYYYQKIQRYSFQRPMIEGYHINALDDSFFTAPSHLGNEKLSVQEKREIIPRLAPYPLYEKIEAELLGGGEVSHVTDKRHWRPKQLIGIGEELVGFKIEDLEVKVTDECTHMEFSERCDVADSCLLTDRYLVYKLPYEASGFLKLKVDCKENIRLYLLFDEICTENGTVDHLRMGCSNVIRYDLCTGSHSLQLFEVYSMQYIQVVAVNGECEIKSVVMTEYKHPPVNIPTMKDKRLQKIAVAAAETFRQNAVDIFMDCPSRERAGWLCDSFFTARTEFYATGQSKVEQSFLENFLHEESYEYLPEGMLPMCYPADFYDKNYIPQWSLWLVLQLGEYLCCSKDAVLVERFCDKISKLFAYFEAYENEDGLLESLGGWQFVEWSMANKLVDGVNYPTNMLYSAALKVAGEMYGDEDYIKKSEHIKQKVLEQSFNGSFFTDNAIRKDGKLESTGQITEVCQYYAFFLEIATPQSHSDLFKTLINDFGPKRNIEETWQVVHPAAPFIGYFLRLDILAQNKMYKELAENIDGYYYDMAEMTGTLWEHASVTASCNHGFSGYVLCWLSQITDM